MQMLEFRYGNYRIIYPENYYQFIKEVFVLDVYRASLLKEHDLVLDLGAGTGDFSILASKKVGQNGKVIAIEPNLADYQILKLNIEKNKCGNVIPLNSGVGAEAGENEFTFWGKTFKLRINTLETILEELGVKNKINFIKMDIEGFEVDVLSASIEIIKEANVISIELHGAEAKKKVDEVLLPKGFEFNPVTMRYVYKKIVENLFLHPHVLYKAYVNTIKEHPNIMRKAITGFDMTKEHLLTGSYIKNSKL
jgi:FkbM family methyltransferase